MSVPEKVGRRLKELPDKPGCYIMRDRRGRVIYVGKASSLRKRVRWYFRNSSLRSASPKVRGLIKSVDDLDVVVVRNDAEAALTESKLIKEFKPRYNVIFKDDKRFPLLKAYPGERFPRLKLCRIERDDGAVYFGPYVSSAAARAAMDFAEKRFGLRKCSPSAPDRSTYKHCINDIVRYCSAPCIGQTTAPGYRQRFEEACAFLRGERMQYLGEVWDAIREAAEKTDYEKAAQLRDIYFNLREAVKLKARIAKTPEMKKEEAMAGIVALKNLLGLEREPRVIEAYDVSNISGAFAVGSMVCAVDGRPMRTRYRRFRIKTGEGPDDTRMMAEIVGRRYERVLKEDGLLPDLVLVDGGATQLSSARKELDRLGLKSLPAAGLAKRLEEIYLPGRKSPLRLDRESPALRVLRQLRDEAHRFAISYHRNLRGKRIRESLLDEIPGVGDKTKGKLLEHFGSVKRLASATIEDVEGVPGIGKAQAGTILGFLWERLGKPDQCG